MTAFSTIEPRQCRRIDPRSVTRAAVP